MPENIWHLRRCGLFADLAPDRLRQLQLGCRLDRFAKRSPIYLPVDQSDSLFLVASGRVKICHLTHEGKQSTLAFVEPGEVFGELAVVDCGPREEYAEAAKDSTVVRIPSDGLCALMQDVPEVARRVTALIGRRRRQVERRLRNLLFLSSRDRLIHLLLELADRYGEAAEKGLRLATDLSHQDLASMIGSTRETVTLVLGELQSEGLIKLGRRKITLARPEAISGLVRRLPGAALPSSLEEISSPLEDTHDVSRAG
jgi:CRP-like cAMP-binding protein